eukprot:TRINITY_DN13732_c0_g1_i3.p1 TRINITY_DN13732_c0_g1~~TRINITY_DN13732_c0_g1_i3.p1  ORF type:complete len:281 (+),score=-5.19 TRINITY_DN13732_c0_g1_i3:99-941(+)
MLQLVFFFATAEVVLSLKDHLNFQASYHLQAIDSTCDNWLAGDGAAFASCFQSGPPPVPEKTAGSNCATNTSAYTSFCSNPCYTTIAEGYKYMVKSGTCMSYFDKFVGCTSNADCNGNVCHKGMCKPACATTDDCIAANPCNTATTTCQPVGSSMACLSNASSTTKSFRLQGALYPWLTLCSTNENGEYCMSLADSVQDPMSLTCDNTAAWGCCLGTLLRTYGDCIGEKFLNKAIYSCPNSKLICNDLPSTYQFCGAGALGLSKFLLLFLLVLNISSLLN